MNDSVVMTHDGGYSSFRADVTDFLQTENHLVVEADHSVNDRVYPQKADFTFYGGIYRDVKLIIVHRHHFDMDYYGGPGIMGTSFFLVDKRVSSLATITDETAAK